MYLQKTNEKSILNPGIQRLVSCCLNERRACQFLISQGFLERERNHRSEEVRKKLDDLINNKGLSYYIWQCVKRGT